jgi:hypothetical protein
MLTMKSPLVGLGHAIALPRSHLPLLKAQVVEYKRFRSMEKALIEVSEQLFDAHATCTLQSGSMARRE